jgi:hypothetical protein
MSTNCIGAASSDDRSAMAKEKSARGRSARSEVVRSRRLVVVAGGDGIQAEAAATVSTVMITALHTAICNENVKPASGEHEVLFAAAALA